MRPFTVRDFPRLVDHVLAMDELPGVALSPSRWELVEIASKYCAVTVRGEELEASEVTLAGAGLEARGRALDLVCRITGVKEVRLLPERQPDTWTYELTGVGPRPFIAAELLRLLQTQLDNRVDFHRLQDDPAVVDASAASWMDQTAAELEEFAS